jgi:membrane fusion protein (multidrug efflux system)
MADSPPTHAAGGRLQSIRKRAFAVVGAVVVIGAIASGVYWLLIGSRYVETNDAYVGADSALVTPLTSGAVTAVLVKETQHVRAGDPLVEIDPADARINVEQADAELSKSRRRVEQYQATESSLAAQVAARETDIAHARAQLDQARSNFDRAQIDLRRRENIASTGAVSGEELTSARDTFATAKANVAAAQSALAQALANRAAAVGEAETNHVLVSGVTLATNPEVLASQAKLDQAKLDLSRATVRAPIDGVVAKRQVQVGQRTSLGATLMTIVPVQDAYVDANFKEVQLRKVHVGQPVELTSDVYGGDVTYHGAVIGFSGGTGSAFAVIPSQNATGNWIKVVQRVAVRVGLDKRELAAHPLLVGLSMKVRIDVAAGKGG